MIPVYLDPSDQGFALRVAHERWRYVEEHNLHAKFGGATEKDHQDGAGGELAFCRALKIPWQATINTFTEVPDVLPNWEIRTLRTMPGVKVVDTDPDDRLVTWVKGQLPRYEVMGYIRAGGAKAHPEWHKDPGKRKRPIWLVPPSRMIPINPDFHRLCAWAQDDWGLWSCAFCGKESTYAQP